MPPLKVTDHMKDTISALIRQNECPEWLFSWYNVAVYAGAVLPLAIWPVLPSTNEGNNAKQLHLASISQLVILLGFRLLSCLNFNNVYHGPSMWVDGVAWCLFLVSRCALRTTPQRTGDGRLNLQWVDLLDAAALSFLLGPYYLFALAFAAFLSSETGGNAATLVLPLTGCFFVCVRTAFWPTVYAIAAAYERFLTRRVAVWFWLPQNGASAPWNPSWACALFEGWVLYAVLLFGSGVIVAAQAMVCKV